MRYYKIGRSVFVSLLVVLSSSFVSSLPMVLKSSRVLAQTVDVRKAEADSLRQQGIQQYQKGQIKAALLSWEQALQIYRQIGDRAGVGRALGNLGVAYRSLGDYQKAIDFHQQHLAIAKELGDRAGVGDALNNLGNAYHSLGDYQKAIDFYQQDLAIVKEIGDRAGVGSTLNNLGNAYRSLGDYQKAIDFHQQDLAIAKELGDRAGVGRALGGLGNAYYSLGNYQKAIDFHQQSLAIVKEIGDRAGVGRALNNLGNAYVSLGDYQKAIDFYQQSLAIFKEIGDRAGVGRALGNLGAAYSDLGDYQKAIDFYQQSLAIVKEIGDRAGVGSALNNLGLAYLSLGDYQKAIDFYQQSLAIFKEIGDRAGVGGALGNLGNVYSDLGDYQKAIDFYQQSLAIFKEIGDRAGVGGALGNLGNAYGFLGDYQKAIDFHQQSLAIVKEIGDRAGVGLVLNNLGLALFHSGNLAEAEKVLKQGIEVLKSQRRRLGNRDDFKISIFEEQAKTYRTLQQVYIAQNQTDAALEVAESGRARAFVDLLTSRLSQEGDVSSSTDATIDQIKQIAKSQNATFVQYSIIYDQFKIASKQQVKESELYIWVIKPTGEVTFRKADLKPLWQKENTTLAELVTTSRNSIGARGTAFRGGLYHSFNPDAPKATNKLKRLHELLINPIADLLPKNPSARVTFIPQSSLFLVPFPALQDKNGQYLIEKHTILTSPSIQVLELTREKRQRIGKQLIQGNNMLIVGNPTMPKIPPKIGEAPQQLTPLPGAEREAKAIAKLFGANPLIGDRATETTVTQRLSQARLIHLATHGIFDDVQGLNSGIALAPNPPLSPLIKEGNTNSTSSPLGKGGHEGGDGLLTAGEILDLKLNAELVVLSACDTGRGKITGDGVIGLSRSWISAGVPSVLVSLWSVPDAPTAELMTEFYQNLQNNPDKAQALRQAMLKIMKQHPNPADWAAFTLIGEAE